MDVKVRRNETQLPRRSKRFSKKNQVTTVAATESGIHVLLCIILTIQIFRYYGVDRLANPSFVLYCTCIYTIHLVCAAASGYLYVVASKSDISGIKTYFKLTVPIYIFWIIITSGHMLIVGNNEVVITLVAAFAIYKLQSFKLVKYFITDQIEIEYSEYWKSLDSVLIGFNSESCKNVHIPQCPVPERTFHFLPYNIDFEIPFESLSLECIPIGAGRFGQVFKGTLRINEEILTVAVKTTNSNADYYSFRSLLYELNILACMGPHDHIVNLIGTSTNIQEKLHIVMEFCANGSVDNFILTRKLFFRNMVKDDRIIVTTHLVHNTNSNYQRLDETLSTLDILQWAYQTALGMKYLQSKNIIHGDLAARNILLTVNKSVKIADFGLSRQKSIYIKRGEDPLPWRWMSPESLRSGEFSSKSDVWSYAVTLWEFFTLCEIPYMDFDYNEKFVDELKIGLRLNQPLFCTTEIYKFMTSCWEFDPNNRPEFQFICEYFKSINYGDNLVINSE